MPTSRVKKRIQGYFALLILLVMLTMLLRPSEHLPKESSQANEKPAPLEQGSDDVTLLNNNTAIDSLVLMSNDTVTTFQ